ncbi:hypothetical protein PanWU01x14_168050 [Parasponia andersonii]|uniref:Transmembrane protein n=1 Tax=Parasponia andersonii TaxID=3476 RepID=A0A2P5CAW3_PARAD|nr:hypothetical protein PanWU01x14_168050 [Parasponia andersonii]
MKAVISSSPPPTLYIPNSSPWKPKSPITTTTLLIPRASKSPNQTKRAQRAKANAKGFPGTPAQTTKETPATQNPGKGSGANDEEIPQVVFDRMIVRILVSVGTPMATGLALLKIFSIFKEQGLWDAPIWLPLLTTLLTFGVSSFGIAYGALSTSWDERSKGSLLGLEEVQRNWVEMWREEDESNS